MILFFFKSFLFDDIDAEKYILNTEFFKVNLTKLKIFHAGLEVTEI